MLIKHWLLMVVPSTFHSQISEARVVRIQSLEHRRLLTLILHCFSRFILMLSLEHSQLGVLLLLAAQLVALQAFVQKWRLQLP